MSSSPTTPPSPVTPIQFTQLTAKDLQDPNLGLLNLVLQTHSNAINTQAGVNGPTVLPSGINVAGGTVTGLAAPTNPSDAIPSGHASDQYGPAAQQNQLDIGKPYALKGLTLLWQKVMGLASQTVGGGNVVGSRTLGAIFQNTSGGLLLVTGAAQVTSGSGDSTLTCLIGPTSPPTIPAFGDTTPVTIAGELVGFSFNVPPGFFYEITKTNLITATPFAWWETIVPIGG